MATLDPQIGTPVIKQGVIASGIVTGIIDFKGPRINGSIAISLAKPVILDIAQRMLSEPFTEIDEVILDLVGELTNMMAGGGKATLSEQGYDFDLTLPRVLVGDGHEINHFIMAQTIIIPFRTDSGEFFVEICFKA